MSKKDDVKRRVRYTQDFKLDAVRRVESGQDRSETARVLGVPKQTLSNWVRLADKGELWGAGDSSVSALQRELMRLHAELARVRRQLDECRKFSQEQFKKQFTLADFEETVVAATLKRIKE
jgi:transposase-like protein